MSSKNDNIDQLFNSLQGSFDMAEPSEGHRERFLEKLNQSKGVVTMTPQKRNWWKPLSIAASIALMVSLGIGYFGQETSIEQRVAEISPEASQTQFYFANLIEEQVRELEEQSSPETRSIIDDALLQLQRLEEDYKRLEIDLLDGGDSKLILSAMITNFQTRIALLEEVMYQINTIKNVKSYNDENYTI
ncbi:MAG: hypothetical protein ABF293_00170 [Flavobacteriaceae bacterium]